MFFTSTQEPARLGCGQTYSQRLAVKRSCSRVDKVFGVQKHTDTIRSNRLQTPRRLHRLASGLRDGPAEGVVIRGRRCEGEEM